MEFDNVVVILAGISTVFLFLYYRMTKNFDYWKKRGVNGPKPIAIFGNFKDVLFGKLHLGELLKNFYDEFPSELVIGLYETSRPVLILRDPDLIKDVLIKNFYVFADRGIKTHPEFDPLSQHLLYLDFPRWKAMRSKLTPFFTSGKLKEMFQSVIECSNHFEKYVNRLVEIGEPIECRELCAKYTTDVIGMCAFGLNMNSISDEDSEFRKNGRKIFADTWHNLARHAVRDLPYWLSKFLKPIARDEEMINFFIDTLKETMDYRKKNNFKRNDFIDILIEIKETPEKVGVKEMTDSYLTSQAYSFFAGGFETTSTTISNALYEMAINQNVQDKLRFEIKNKIQDSDSLTYETINDLKYLDKVFNEVLRKYPPGMVGTRLALEDYEIPNTKIKISKGTRVLIPVYGIHYNTNVYPEPEKFDPERFDDELVKSRHPMHHLPFGDGPKNCIGKRFAIYQIKVGLIKLIANFKFDVCDKTFKKYIFNTRTLLLSPKSGIYLKISKL